MPFRYKKCVVTVVVLAHKLIHRFDILVYTLEKTTPALPTTSSTVKPVVTRQPVVTPQPDTTPVVVMPDSSTIPNVPTSSAVSNNIGANAQKQAAPSSELYSAP